MKLLMEKEKVYGFSKERINNWEKHLEDWEVNLINYLCGLRLKKLGYKSDKINKDLLSKGLNILKKDKFLNRELRYFLKNNKGNKKVSMIQLIQKIGNLDLNQELNLLNHQNTKFIKENYLI